MKDLFMTLLNLLHENETVTAIYLYGDGKFSRIDYKTADGKYSLTISKDDENGEL